MASLILIPTELLDSVFAYLSTPELLSLATVCRKLHQRSQALLYQAVSLRWDAQHVATAQHPLQLLLRSILRAPKLGEHIQKLEFRCDGYRGYREKFALSQRRLDIDAAEMQLLCNSWQRSELPNDEIWEEGLRNGSVHATAAFLLTLLKRLKSLKMSLDLLAGSRFLSTLTGHALNGQFLPELEDVTLGTDVDGDGDGDHYRMVLGIEQFHPFLCLPHLKSAQLQLPDVREVPTSNDPTIIRQGSSNHSTWTWIADHTLRFQDLTVLQLQYTRAPAYMLKQILSATPALAVLEYDYWCNTNWWGLRCNQLAEAISQVRGSLKHLKIALTPFITDQCGELQEMGDVWVDGSLGTVTKACQKLESFEIAPVVLFGYHPKTTPDLSGVLPRSLQYLILRDDLLDYLHIHWLEPATIDLVARYMTRGHWALTTPHLAEVNLHLCESQECYEWDRKAQKQVSDVVQAQGLMCHVIREHQSCPRRHIHDGEEGYVNDNHL